MKKIILILASVLVMSHQVHANSGNDDDDSLQGYTIFFPVSTRIGESLPTMVIHIPASLKSATNTNPYSIVANSQQITVTGSNNVKSVTCTMTPTTFSSPIAFNGYLTMINTFNQPKQKLYVSYSNGVCMDFSVQ